MFGTDQKDLLEGLENLRSNICGYAGPTCDCKYGIEKVDQFAIKKYYGEDIGCPEVRQAMEMLKALTNDEFNDLCLKSGMMRSDIVKKALEEHLNKK